MKATSQDYLKRLKDKYVSYGDQDSLNALAEIESHEDRIRTLKIYREQPKTMEIINAALQKYKVCVEMLTSHDMNKKMTDADRAYCFAAMDWAKYTLDIVGENPDRTEESVDELVESYARKAGVIPN